MSQEGTMRYRNKTMFLRCKYNSSKRVTVSCAGQIQYSTHPNDRSLGGEWVPHIRRIQCYCHILEYNLLQLLMNKSPPLFLVSIKTPTHYCMHSKRSPNPECHMNRGVYCCTDMNLSSGCVIMKIKENGWTFYFKTC
jgi:hypothetical protein